MKSMSAASCNVTTINRGGDALSAFISLTVRQGKRPPKGGWRAARERLQRQQRSRQA